MNEEWVLSQLRSFVRLTQLVTETYDYGSYDRTAASEQEVVASAQVIEKILGKVIPLWRQSIPVDVTGKWLQHHEAALRAIAEVETAAEVQANLGDTSPTMTAAAMHPWVWESAESLWGSGHFGEAVMAATVKLNAELQNKVGRRDIGETALFQQSYSNDSPTSARPRLRPHGDDDGSTAKSLRRGIMSLAEGVYAGLRNPYSHDGAADTQEQVALEQLATVSLLARWIDGSEVVRN
ncbi:MAG: TIGR02391 family protein [Actinomycetota bacterium]